ncbi:MAG TPA: TonB-dependent receptor [Bryobacteraceae bacterium]|nr:TonB-dependent receptor [Bryobacteraceae bacterium]
MKRILLISLALWSAGVGAMPASAQGTGSSGTITGTVVDPSGASIAGAMVEIKNQVTGFEKSTTTDNTGMFKFLGVAPNTYHMTVAAPGFNQHVEDVDVRTTVPVNLKVMMAVASSTQTLNVTSSADIVESVPTAHVDMDASQFEKLPMTSATAGLNEAIAHSAPGIVEDSNGLIHPQGDHAQTQFVFDNQPVTDQQSKQFSISMPENAIASMEIITGAPPAEYGDKTSLVINAITKSGLGVDKPFGSETTSYGSFGTVDESFTSGVGGKQWGEFIAIDGVRSGRYLDPPEFSALHDVGNKETIFNRLDYQPDQNDSLHLNLFVARAWFQTPNTYDQQSAGQDQRERILSYNIAPGWVRILNPHSTITVSPYVRQDQVHYYPSRNPFADQPATVGESRRLTNAGVKADFAYVNQHNNFKAGVQVQHTFLDEDFFLGVTQPGFVESSDSPGLAPYDLTAGGHLFTFTGHTDIKEYAIYAQDNITYGGWNFQAGLRGDFYRGITAGSSAEPRLGVSYLVKPSNTVLRISYSKFYETPYNENLLVSSVTGAGGLAGNVFGAFGSTPLRPGTRDQYNVGLQQGIGKHLVVDAGYFWKYTHNAFDFDTLFNTPIVFPIEWRKSKIDGAAARVTLTDIKGFSAYMVLGHTRARFFGPENGGLIFNSPLNNSVFRIDHDQALEQTTNLRYQPKKNGPWASFTWRYDSGEVAGAVGTLGQVYALTGDEQAAIGFHCGSMYATVGNPITSCPAGNATANLVRIPAPGTENDDTNPPRIAPRNVFDVALGDDDLFHTDRLRYRVQFTAINITNVVALYNFLSTFSGTHFISPRAYTAEFGVVW